MTSDQIVKWENEKIKLMPKYKIYLLNVVYVRYNFIIFKLQFINKIGT